MLLLNDHFVSDKVIYCNSNNMTLNKTLNCAKCPIFANCSNGTAFCPDVGYVLHPKRGCLPQKQYEKRRNGEKLYLRLYDILKQQRRRFVMNCNEDIIYDLNISEIGSYFEQNMHHFNWNGTVYDEAMEALTQILWENETKQKIRKNVSNDAYYAVLSEWELGTTNDCNEMNWLLVGKVYGIELSVSIVCISIMLISWRRLTV